MQSLEFLYDRNGLLTGAEIGWSTVCKDSEDDQCFLERIYGSKCLFLYTVYL